MNGSSVRRVALVTFLVVAATALSGCFAFKQVETAPPQVRTETKTIPKAGTSELDARVRMPAGMLKVDGETKALVDMKFESTNPAWLPVVSTTRSEGASGTITGLEVAVPQSVPFLRGNTKKYEWNIHLSPDVPSRLRFELGAGQSEIDLRGVDVRRLSVTTGVGETALDLSGARTHDLLATVKCGIGEVTIRVPASAGVRVTGRQEGIGNLTADGFTLSGEQLTNAAWATSPTKIEISLQRGIGDVNIETVD